jgi:diguanylate cyclase (GGDEF)-like protein/putative nucleotidyltransferase with HDIG domain
MSPTRALSRTGQAYVWIVIAVGIYVIGVSMLDASFHPLPWQWFLLATLTLVSGSATVNLPSVPASISISETFVFTAVLLYGTAAGTLVVALDGLVISFWMAKRHREFHRALFNTCAPAVSAWASSHLFFVTAGIAPLASEPAGLATSLDRVLPALILFATTYFGLNSWLITFAIVAERRLKPLAVWREHFIWLSLNYFCGASVAFLLVTYTRNIDIRYVAVIVPLLLVLYFTFKTSMARVEDANLHVEKIDRLYLSTIETLAMAIDAKDQITHGHIRRVQTYAVGLARKIGITDEKLVKAIEAAALLHDMGKLAVPEYILNKPGKLTPAEFEKMKLHASVGADILSAIDFPYPVVPIVRHHHEYWNGAGYPDGLKSTDIPIGARILAIVDCFDALTSDRPYRPRLPDSEALRIVMDRRGTMYDPLIVDTFVRVHKELALPSDPYESQETAPSNENKTGSRAAAPRLDDIAAGADEMLTMYELVSALAGQVSVNDLGTTITSHLRRLVPFTLCVLYVYQSTSDDLEAAYALGEGSSTVKGLRIPLGHRLSGWVAVNRQTIVNSDPTLDLGEVARTVSPRLRNCLSTPLIFEGHLVGVLTLYTGGTDGFSENHRRIVEAVAQQAAYPIKNASEVHTSDKGDAWSDLPTIERLEQAFTLTASRALRISESLFVVFIDVTSFKQIYVIHGRPAADEALRLVAEHTRAALQPTDVLFKYGVSEFVALVDVPDTHAATALADRICDSVRRHPLVLRAGKTTVDISATVIKAPQDATTLRQVITVAREQKSAAPDNRPPSVH